MERLKKNRIECNPRRVELHITPYSRIGSTGVRSEFDEAFQYSRKREQPDTSHHLTVSRPLFGLKVVGRRESIKFKGRFKNINI